MAVKVNRFMVRHNGKVFGPGQQNGQIITGLSEEEEAHLINNSNGTIEKYNPEELNAVAQEPETAQEQKPEQEIQEATGENDEFNINPDDFIKPGNENNEGKNKGENNGKANNEHVEVPDVNELTVEEIKEQLKQIENLEILQGMLDLEQKSDSPRKSALSAIKEKMDSLKEDE